MTKLIPPRMRAPARMLAGGAIITAAVAATDGWVTLLHLGPVTLAATAGYYVLGGRETDFAAMLRAQADEREHYRRLKIQALGGRVTAGALAAAYVAAVAAKAPLWPFATSSPYRPAHSSSGGCSIVSAPDSRDDSPDSSGCWLISGREDRCPQSPTSPRAHALGACRRSPPWTTRSCRGRGTQGPSARHG